MRNHWHERKVKTHLKYVVTFIEKQMDLSMVENKIKEFRGQRILLDSKRIPGSDVQGFSVNIKLI